ncbi:hypothetical protein ES703_102983 [subsurface metagenome]
MKIKTINKHFDDAWNYLQTKHESLESANRFWIDLTKKPGLSQKEWIFYIDKLIELVEIGQRNNWLAIHMNGKGFAVYLVLDYQKCLIKKEN